MVRNRGNAPRSTVYQTVVISCILIADVKLFIRLADPVGIDPTLPDSKSSALPLY
jgi:hypothetical protein